jgi:hypothetical protein
VFDDGRLGHRTPPNARAATCSAILQLCAFRSLTLRFWITRMPPSCGIPVAAGGAPGPPFQPDEAKHPQRQDLLGLPVSFEVVGGRDSP